MTPPLKGSSWRSSYKLGVYFFFTLICMPVQVLALRLPGQFKAWFPYAYHAICLRLFGIRIIVRGAKSSLSQPTLFVANHSSYLDIPVLSAVIPGSFVAKKEVGDLPFFGTLARLQRTVFVERRRGSVVAHEKNVIQSRLDGGDSLVLFAEGTSTDGQRTLPFKSSLFSAVMNGEGDSKISVQPVSITAISMRGIPVGRSLRPLYAWLGDEDNPGPHLANVAGLGCLDVLVEFHPPVMARQFDCRKALTQYCWEKVAQGVNNAVTGRWEEKATMEETYFADSTAKEALGPPSTKAA